MSRSAGMTKRESEGRKSGEVLIGSEAQAAVIEKCVRLDRKKRGTGLTALTGVRSTMCNPVDRGRKKGREEGFSPERRTEKRRKRKAFHRKMKRFGRGFGG